MAGDRVRARVVKAVHGLQKNRPDPRYEGAMARALAADLGREKLLEILAQFAVAEDPFSRTMRRVIVKAVAKRCGDGLVVGSNVTFRHLETMEFGSGCYIGPGAYLQGWYDGRCVIGNNVWIGPQAYFDARYLELEDYVGWGPGAKMLGSQHTGVPADVPIVKTDLAITEVRVGAWADVGTNAVLMPGVMVGKGAIVGAGAVVTKNVQPFAIVAGVPARFLRWRDGAPGKKAAAPRPRRRRV